MSDINLKEAEIQRKQAIGARIKKIRKDKRITQKQFAEMIGKSMSSIQKYEDGTTDVPVEVIELMATQLGCTIISIVGETSWSEDHFSNVYGFQPDNNEREVQTLLDNYNKLNNKGRQEALKRIYELTLVPGYIAYEFFSEEDKSNKKMFAKKLEDLMKEAKRLDEEAEKRALSQNLDKIDINR